ncbi:bicaudal-D-related protein 2-like [Etheostoma cragini]|uniref:bicaudal-D-related protein 2-like n=1 Tax=Etheostoma cragini TaxID=417921 RepID=UPI00155E39D4|nr:bicaudal-D-related protein 2-like [Etheostoma cragini]
MDYAQSFSALNERLRPQITKSEQLSSPLNRLEEKQLNLSHRSKSSSCRPTVLPTELKPKDSVATTEPEDPEEPEDNYEQEDLVSDEENCADRSNDSCLITEFSLKDLKKEEPVDDTRNTCSPEEKQNPGEPISKGTGDSSESDAVDGEGGSSFQKSYMNWTLPDLINSGRPLNRRRTLGQVSDTLKEVRREVELSRRRSIRLKAQVDKLQESSEGPGWSQHREKVTEEVLSILGLLRPLTKLQYSLPEPSDGVNRLDASLSQLQNVARELAISHTKQFKSGERAEDSAVLQQALRDRDGAIEKKKAMEAELLRSKTEMMLLNNQLLEAVQKRLELAVELDTWKEDVRLIIHQQLQSQQQAEQAQKKPSRLGILRRTHKLPIQRPTNFPLSTPAPPTTNSNQIFIPRAVVSPAPSTLPSTGTQRNWREKLRWPKTGRQGDEDAAGQELEGRGDNSFQVVSLD